MGDAWKEGNRGGQAWGAAAARDPAWVTPPGRDQGWAAIDKILGDRTLPKWNSESERFEPHWTQSDIGLANLVIKNTQNEMEMSKEQHDHRKAQDKAIGRPWDGTNLNLGFLERTNIWERVCKKGAVLSVVIKLVGLQLREKKHGGIDRAAAATQVHAALMFPASQYSLFRNCILDVVCSKADREQTGSQGVIKTSATFYVRVPAFLGMIAHEQWLPRLRETTIMTCNVTAYLLYGTGKESMGVRNAQHWPTTVYGVEQKQDMSDYVKIRDNTYDPESSLAKKIAQDVLNHSDQYAKKEIGDFAFFKALPLQNLTVPATRTDGQTLYGSWTWRLYQMLKSGDAATIWNGLLTLMAAGAGEVRNGKWHPQQHEGGAYKMYCPGTTAYDKGKFGGEGGHLDLFTGELALTFETPVLLTYTDPKDKDKLMQMNGMMAMAVSTCPQFNIRRCSTFHWAREDYEVSATEYVIMRDQISKLVAKGVDQLAYQLGLTLQRHGTQQTVTQVILPVTQVTLPMPSTVTMPPLIDLETPREQEQSRVQPIPLPEGMDH